MTSQRHPILIYKYEILNRVEDKRDTIYVIDKNWVKAKDRASILSSLMGYNIHINKGSNVIGSY